jgi:hypothetical protein
MGIKETRESVTAQLEASKAGHRLWRNNRGVFYTESGNKTRAGLEAGGSSDLIGFTVVTVTPDMVGRDIAVLTVAEMKRPEWKKPSSKTEKQQEMFIDFVNKSGGIGFFCNNGKNIVELIKKGVDRLRGST